MLGVRNKRGLGDNGYLLFALPGMVFLILFNYIPMAGLYMVFTDYNFKDGIFGSPFVGLANFEFFFYSLSSALRATWNTLSLNFFFILFGAVIVPLCLAICLNEARSKRFKRISQSLVFFPYFLSWAAVGAIMYILLDEKSGALNHLLAAFGCAPVAWYSEPGAWTPILVLSNVWKMAGYNSIIYFAALTAIDPAYYESAMIDGASKWTQIKAITIPLLKPTVMVMFLLGVGRIMFGDLGMILGMTNLNPLLLPTTDIIDTFVYRTAIRGGEFALASAVTLYQSVVGLVILVIANAIAGRFGREYRLI